MVGFPGETDEDFADTVSLIESLPFTYLHVFSYSKRQGTPAADMNDAIPSQEAGRRSALLREIGRRRSLSFRRSLAGEVVNVLVEGGAGRSREAASGLAGNYVRVEVGAAVNLANQIVPVRILGAEDGRTWGEIANGPSSRSSSASTSRDIGTGPA
jgi:threonylcarbamoyladenosine tRNA methylthiotransferase MtaB